MMLNILAARRERRPTDAEGVLPGSIRKVRVHLGREQAEWWLNIELVVVVHISDSGTLTTKYDVKYPG